MLSVLGILYGIHVVFLIYLIAYFSARGALRGGVFSVVLILGKYFLYWLILKFGFQHLPIWSIITGLIGGIYLSLPILYYINKKLNPENEEGAPQR